MRATISGAVDRQVWLRRADVACRPPAVGVQEVDHRGVAAPGQLPGENLPVHAAIGRALHLRGAEAQPVLGIDHREGLLEIDAARNDHLIRRGPMVASIRRGVRIRAFDGQRAGSGGERLLGRQRHALAVGKEFRRRDNRRGRVKRATRGHRKRLHGPGATAVVCDE